MSTAPRFSVLFGPSLDFVGVIDDLEADISYRFNYEIRFAPDAATIPFEDKLSRLCHLIRQLIPILDLEFARVEIHRCLVVIIIVVIVVVATKPILLVIVIDSLHEGRALLHVHIPPKLDYSTLCLKHLVYLRLQILHQVIQIRLQIDLFFARFEDSFLNQTIERLLSVHLGKCCRCSRHCRPHGVLTWNFENNKPEKKI